jgi:hypothetical protein
MSSSIRYWADDFCIAVVHRKYGILEAQKFWWNAWSGRYSYNFMLHVFNSFGEQIIKILPLLIYSGLLLSILPICLNVFNRSRYKFQKSILLASFLILLILINAPNIIQSFYWQTGSIIYSIPFVFLNLFLSLVYLATKDTTKKLERFKTILLPFLLVFIGGGFVETFAIAQLMLIALMIICGFIIKFLNGARVRKVLFAGLLGSVLSLIIMSVSPGAAARRGTFSQGKDIVFILRSTLLGAKWYLLRFITIRTSIYSLIALFSLIYYLVSRYFRRIKGKIEIKIKDLIIIDGFSILLAIFSTLSVFAVSYYAMSYLPPERALFVVVYFIFVAFILFSISISLIINIVFENKQKMLGIISIFLYLISIVFLFRTFYSHWDTLRGRMEDYAYHWDIQEKEIYKQKGEGSKNIIIKYVQPAGDIDGFIENEGWVSACAAEYYQVDEIRVVE